MSSRTVLSTLVLVVLVAGVFAADAAGTRQTTGIYVNVDGRSHSLFFDFPSTYAGEGGTFDVPTRFNADLEVWIEGSIVRAGQHRWQLRVEAADRWTLGPLPKDRRDKPTRYLFDVRKVAESREWMSASFTPEPSGESVILTVMLGDREGTLRVHFREAPANVPDGNAVDARQLERERDSLLKVAAEIEEVRLRRHLWSNLVKTLGDEMVAGAGTGWIDELDFSLGEEWASLTIRGHLPGKATAVNELSKRLKETDLGQVFRNFRVPLSKVAEGDMRYFGLTADIKAEDWRNIDPIAPRQTGRNPQKLAEEILLLESRIAHLAPASVTDLNQGRSLLLAAKRKAGALLPEVTPGEPVNKENGIGWFDVTLRVEGSGPGLVDFIRALEDRKEPIRISPVKMRGSAYGPELTLRLSFLSYRPLSVRNPAVWAAVNSRGRGPDFDRIRREYLEKVGNTGDRPYAPPTWLRDPLFKPPPEKHDK